MYSQGSSEEPYLQYEAKPITAEFLRSPITSPLIRPNSLFYPEFLHNLMGSIDTTIQPPLHPTIKRTQILFKHPPGSNIPTVLIVTKTFELFFARILENVDYSLLEKALYGFFNLTMQVVFYREDVGLPQRPAPLARQKKPMKRLQQARGELPIDAACSQSKAPLQRSTRIRPPKAPAAGRVSASSAAAAAAAAAATWAGAASASAAAAAAAAATWAGAASAAAAAAAAAAPAAVGRYPQVAFTQEEMIQKLLSVLFGQYNLQMEELKNFIIDNALYALMLDRVACSLLLWKRHYLWSTNIFWPIIFQKRYLLLSNILKIESEDIHHAFRHISQYKQTPLELLANNGAFKRLYKAYQDKKNEGNTIQFFHKDTALNNELDNLLPLLKGKLNFAIWNSKHVQQPIQEFFKNKLSARINHMAYVDTPVTSAVFHACFHNMAVFLKNGASFDFRINSNGHTVLHIACYWLKKLVRGYTSPRGLQLRPSSLLKLQQLITIAYLYVKNLWHASRVTPEYDPNAIVASMLRIEKIEAMQFIQDYKNAYEGHGNLQQNITVLCNFKKEITFFCKSCILILTLPEAMHHHCVAAQALAPFPASAMVYPYQNFNTNDLGHGVLDFPNFGLDDLEDDSLSFLDLPSPNSDLADDYYVKGDD